jgi:acyl-CoA reductase-like NAD-dependent aldehyde dehydrogenase
MAIATHNPATGETIKSFTPHDDTQVDAIVQRAARAFPAWSAMTIEVRAAALTRAAQVHHPRVGQAGARSARRGREVRVGLRTLR